MVTYYPAPVSAFDRLRLIPRTTITTACDANTLGSLYVEEPDALTFCRDTGSGFQWTSSAAEYWEQNGDTIYLKDTLNPTAKKVGIGTSSPSFKLTLENDGGILAIGDFGNGETLMTSGAGTRFIWYPRKAAIRAGQVTGTQWDETNIGNYSVAFGFNTKASSIKSVVLGGEGNIVSISTSHDGYGSIGGGRNNLVSDEGVFDGSYGTVVGGDANLAKGLYSFIGGGRNNSISGVTIPLRA